jgi:hypothetical protein
MQAYLAAHDAFVAWLDSIDTDPTAAEVEEHLRGLALTAAARGMTSTHWAFVIDGLVAYVNRIRPGDILLSSYIARGFDYSADWSTIKAQASNDAAGDSAAADRSFGT